MKYKIMFTSLSLSLIGLLSINNNFTHANALLTPPTHDYSYKYESSRGAWAVAKNGVVDNYLPTFVRTTDVSSFKYNGDIRYELNGGNAIKTSWPFDTLTQYRVSNTSWIEFNPSYYVPSVLSVGTSLTTTGIAKMTFSFNNNTSKAYALTFDFDSSSSTKSFFFTQNAVGNRDIGMSVASLNTFYLPPQTTYLFTAASTSANFLLDAIYLDDLGVIDSNAYEDGYDIGYEDGIEQGYKDANLMNDASSGLFDIMTSLFTAVGVIFNIRVMPGISLGMLVFVPLIFTLLFFILKFLRGGS